MTHRMRSLLAILGLALAGVALPGCVAVAIPALAGSALLGNEVRKERETVAAVLPATPAAESTPTMPPASSFLTTRPGFSRVVQYGLSMAMKAKTSTEQLSAMLSDPIALNGERRRCAAGQKPIVVIDLDPKGGLLPLPADADQQPVLSQDLAMLRDAGLAIAWLSDLPAEQSVALRTALVQSGLDPRGEDAIALRHDSDDRKQVRKEKLADKACIVAIAGDERADFDERFQYLRNPEAGAALENLIGDGWFLTEPIFSTQGPQGQ